MNVLGSRKKRNYTKKPKITKTTYLCKLNVNASNLRTFFSRFDRDYDDLAMLFFPQKSARAKREAFVLIMKELLKHGKIQSFDHLACNDNDNKIPLSTICKARKEMRLIGLIDYRDYGWTLSTRLSNNLRKFADLMDSAMNKRKKEMNE